MTSKQTSAKSLTPKDIAKLIISEYQPSSFKEVTEILKGIYAPVLEEMLQGELEGHLGYSSGDHQEKQTSNRRNGYTPKTVRTSQGELEIRVPRDREGSFEPQIVPKRSRDISEIEDKILAMYAKGMSQRDISDMINDIYGFSLSAETISAITDRVYPVVEEWRNRPLSPCYPFVFVDCLYVTIKNDRGARKQAVYVVLGYDADGQKDILGFWIGESESKHYWMEIFDQLKSRGVQDIFFLSMDGLSGLEQGAKAIFPQVVVQRCIVHLLRNSLKYVPARDRAEFCRDAKAMYAAVSREAASRALDDLTTKWDKYPGAVRVWTSNFEHVLQLFNYGSAVRKVMYTTNAIESVNSSLRKVTKKGAFPNEESVYKALYLRACELFKKWQGHSIANWSMVRNQLEIEDDFAERLNRN